jgi:hypothetical protein
LHFPQIKKRLSRGKARARSGFLRFFANVVSTSKAAISASVGGHPIKIEVHPAQLRHAAGFWVPRASTAAGVRFRLDSYFVRGKKKLCVLMCTMLI